MCQSDRDRGLAHPTGPTKRDEAVLGQVGGERRDLPVAPDNSARLGRRSHARCGQRSAWSHLACRSSASLRHRSDKAISATGHVEHEVLAARLLAQSSPELCDVEAQAALFDCEAGPGSCHQIGLANDISSTVDQQRLSISKARLPSCTGLRSHSRRRSVRGRQKRPNDNIVLGRLCRRMSA